MYLSDQLKLRTKRFALDIVDLFRGLPKTDEARVIGRQLLRAGTSVGANYRAACRSRSRADFISKIAVVLEETDESAFWMEVMGDAGIVGKEKLGTLIEETSQLLAIFGASLATARRNK